MCATAVSFGTRMNNSRSIECGMELKSRSALNAKALSEKFLPKFDPLKPSVALLCKLGSAVVHAEELLSPKGHVLDKEALGSLLTDPEVKDWVKAMGVYLPVKR